MKKKRNSNIEKIFWITLLLLLILGLIVKFMGMPLRTFPEEESSTTSNTVSDETLLETTTPPRSETENITTEEPETIPTLDVTIDTSEIETAPTPESTTDTQEPETVPEEIEYVGTIYLTFDDGPSIESTPLILDILKENNIPATFFILDYKHESSKEELVLRAFNEGHTIGLHGTSHTYSKIYSSLDNLIENFESLQEKVYVTTGYRSNIIRFPGGSSNTVSKHYCTGIMTEAVEYFSSTDFLYFDWNVDSEDAGGALSSEEIFENVTSSIKPGRNNIVLMHDSSNKKYTVEALQNIINWALAEGYEFKAITEDTPQVIHKVAN